MDTYLLYKAVKSLNDNIFTDSEINQTFQNISNLGNGRVVNQPHLFNSDLSNLESLIASRSKQLIVPTSEEEFILNIYGFTPFYSNFAIKRINKIRNSSAPGLIWQEFNTYFNEFNTSKTKSAQIVSILEPLPTFLNEIPPENGIIEVVFDKGVSINEITQFKLQSEDWYLILSGYAAFLDIKPEDFVIVSIEKHSPARVNLMAAMVVIGFILDTTTNLIEIEKTIYPTKDAIEKLKNTEGIADDLKEAFIKKAEDDLDKKLKEYIDVAINTKLTEKGFIKENSHEKILKLNTAIINQRDFINNGGTINFPATPT